ncbi:MAG: hypothetical protein ABSC17_11540 [Thermacetogeniaceae bacterium]
MDFADELARRARVALERYQSFEAMKRIRSEQNQIIIDIKTEIEKVFAIVTQFYPNAIVTPTHTINESGEIVSVLGAFKYCIITFTADESYGFPTPVHFAFGIFPSEDYQIIDIVCDYMDGGKCRDHIKPLLRHLEKRHESGDYIYDGCFDPAGIQFAVEQAVLALLDRYASSMQKRAVEPGEQTGAE